MIKEKGLVNGKYVEIEFKPEKKATKKKSSKKKTNKKGE